MASVSGKVAQSLAKGRQIVRGIFRVKGKFRNLLAQPSLLRDRKTKPRLAAHAVTESDSSPLAVQGATG